VILAGVTFVFVLAVVVGGYVLFIARPEAEARRALAKRMRPEESAKRGRLAVPSSELKERGASAFGTLRRIVDQSGRKITVPGLLFMCWISGFAAALLLFALTGGVVVTVGAGLLVGAMPYAWVKRAATKRMWKFEEQFPEAIELVARALRAGHAFPTGLSMVADEVGEPVGPEFKLLYDRQNFGMPLADALRAFANRVPILDARFFVTAVLTQREAGGNLSGVLDNLAAVIRERFKVKRQVRVISAHGRMTAAVLSGLPPVVAVGQMLIAPDRFKLLFTDPRGQAMLIGAVGLQVLGMLIIRKIVDIKY
jgi:tight adherence protein B